VRTRSLLAVHDEFSRTEPRRRNSQNPDWEGGAGVLVGGVSRSKRPAGCPLAVQAASGLTGSMRVSE